MSFLTRFRNRTSVLAAGAALAGSLATAGVLTAPAAHAATNNYTVQAGKFTAYQPYGLYRSALYPWNDGPTVVRYNDHGGHFTEIFSVYGDQPTASTIRAMYWGCNADASVPASEHWTCTLTYKPGYIDMRVYKNGVLTDPGAVPSGYSFSIYAVVYK